MSAKQKAKKARPTRPLLSPFAKKRHKEVNSYLERRIELADEQEDSLEIRYLETCLEALAICELLGAGLEPREK